MIRFSFYGLIFLFCNALFAEGHEQNNQDNIPLLIERHWLDDQKSPSVIIEEAFLDNQENQNDFQVITKAPWLDDQDSQPKLIEEDFSDNQENQNDFQVTTKAPWLDDQDSQPKLIEEDFLDNQKNQNDFQVTTKAPWLDDQDSQPTLIEEIFSDDQINVAALKKEHWQNDQYIQDSFIEIALEREYKETKHPKIIRWNKPIKLFFESENGDADLQKELLSVHANHLSHIINLPIDFTNDPTEANLFAIFTTYDNMENKVRQYIGDPERIRTALDEAICLANFTRNTHYEITKGSIIIPVDYARKKARLLDCIVEEITQLLGLPNDSDDVFPSIFNDVSIDTYLSPLDYLLLKALYSPHLKQGMDVTQTSAAFPRILDDFHHHQEIKNAVQRVQENSLRLYLGD